eukprot:m.164245 g.164245  ORF g.164245 m.164245 type:complete len:1300 (+) comp24937_c0_seq4:8-3907(+)
MKAFQCFGLSLVELVALPGETSPPRVLVFLCEYLKERASTLLAQNSNDNAEFTHPGRRIRSVREDLLSLLSEPVDDDMFEAVRQRFVAGDFYDCKSGPCMFRLLKAFFRELSAPVVPAVRYKETLHIASQHMQSAVQRVRENEQYEPLLQSHGQPLGGVLDTWFSALWKTHFGQQIPLECPDLARGLRNLVATTALSVRHPISDLEELFFNLSRPNRDTLEYLGECLVQLDLLCTLDQSHNSQTKPDDENVLHTLAKTFAPYVTRPATWQPGTSQSERKTFQFLFLLLFCFFIKRKHNILTSQERLELEQDEDTSIQEKLQTLSAPSAQLSKALTSILSPSLAVNTTSPSIPNQPVAPTFPEKLLSPMSKGAPNTHQQRILSAPVTSTLPNNVVDVLVPQPSMSFTNEQDPFSLLRAMNKDFFRPSFAGYDSGYTPQQQKLQRQQQQSLLLEAAGRTERSNSAAQNSVTLSHRSISPFLNMLDTDDPQDGDEGGLEPSGTPHTGSLTVRQPRPNERIFQADMAKMDMHGCSPTDNNSTSVPAILEHIVTKTESCPEPNLYVVRSLPSSSSPNRQSPVSSTSSTYYSTAVLSRKPSLLSSTETAKVQSFSDKHLDHHHDPDSEDKDGADTEDKDVDDLDGEEDEENSNDADDVDESQPSTETSIEQAQAFLFQHVGQTGNLCAALDENASFPVDSENGLSPLPDFDSDDTPQQDLALACSCLYPEKQLYIPPGSVVTVDWALDFPNFSQIDHFNDSPNLTRWLEEPFLNVDVNGHHFATEPLPERFPFVVSGTPTTANSMENSFPAPGEGILHLLGHQFSTDNDSDRAKPSSPSSFVIHQPSIHPNIKNTDSNLSPQKKVSPSSSTNTPLATPMLDPPEPATPTPATPTPATPDTRQVPRRPVSRRLSLISSPSSPKVSKTPTRLLFTPSRSLVSTPALLPNPAMKPSKLGPSPARAINYDYAIAFPRTHAETASRELDTDSIHRFDALARVQKASFEADTHQTLLNQNLPSQAIETNTETQCDNCGIALVSSFAMTRGGKKTFCRYCNRTLCTNCCDRSFVIPSFMLQRGDFEVHPVCVPCESHLQQHMYLPLLEFNRLSATAEKAIGRNRVALLRQARAAVMRCLYLHVLPACPSRKVLISLIPESATTYLALFPDTHGARISIADLCELQTRRPLQSLETLQHLFENHTTHCPHCKNVERYCGAGVLCCKQSESDTTLSSSTKLSPAGPMDELVLCRICAEFCHRDCWSSSSLCCLQCSQTAPTTDVSAVRLCRRDSWADLSHNLPLWDIVDQTYFR